MHVGRVSGTLFRGFTSLWMVQDSSKHLLEVWAQEMITLASSHGQLIGCLVEWECSASVKMVKSQLRTDLWCSLGYIGFC